MNVEKGPREVSPQKEQNTTLLLPYALLLVNFFKSQLSIALNRVWTKSEVGHGLGHGVSHDVGHGVPYDLPVVNFFSNSAEHCCKPV